MDVESIREYCLTKPGATEGFPFGDDTLVFKINGKIFLLVSLTGTPTQFNAKCDPEEAIELREKYESIRPGYHMNKKLWNTVIMDGTVPGQLIKKLIDDSYSLVVRSLPKKFREDKNFWDSR